MDPMLQLANRFLAAEINLERKAWGQINDAIRGEIGKGEKRWQLPSWDLRDERAQDILAEVLYKKPNIARRLCELRPELCPDFVHYLADEARKLWQDEKKRQGNGLLPSEGIHDVFTRHKYDVHERFPEALELALVGQPKLMIDLAAYLKAAVPFTLVLHQETQEIERSRLCRLDYDTDAVVAREMKEIARLYTALDRIPEEDARKQDYLNRLEKEIGEVDRIAEDEDKRKTARTSLTERGGKSHTNQSRRKDDPPNQASSSDAGRSDDDTPTNYPPAKAEELSLFGLALSGGGIRSATFNLGMLQGLADLDLLRSLDYLSGVSGGAYIASWLAAWVKREPDGVRKVQRWLSPSRSPTPDTVETQPIHFLRRFSSYLAPRKGPLSTDSVALFTSWLRNTLLNQLVLVLFLASILGIPKLVFWLCSHPQWLRAHDKGWIEVLTVACLFYLATMIGLNLHRFDHEPRPGRGDRRLPAWIWESVGIHVTIVLGFLIFGILGAWQVWWMLAKGEKPPWEIYLVLFGALLWGQLCARTWRAFYSNRPEETTMLQTTTAVAFMIVASALSAGVGSGLFYSAFHLIEQQILGGSHQPVNGFVDIIHKEKDIHIPELLDAYPTAYASYLNQHLAISLVIGPAILIGILFLAIIFQLGLMGRNLPDSRREWWSRLSAKVLLTSSFWMILSLCSYFAPYLVLRELDRTNYRSLISAFIVWVGTTISGYFWGRSSPAMPVPVPGVQRARQLGSVRSKLYAAVAAIAPYVYIGGLAILLSFSQYWLVRRWTPYPLSKDQYWCADSLTNETPQTCADVFVGPLWLPFALFSAALILAWRFDVNEFSMHHLYRNRLVRCYLGASRASGARNPNPFTGFDPNDDLEISSLRVRPPTPYDLAKAGTPYYGPFLVINTALNLVTGKELAWQQRKAASFTFTPLYCGYEYQTTREQPKRNLTNYGYRPTEEYVLPRFHGPTLGTGMAISGAALNPNMGYHSSPGLSFLLAVFNGRLGRWCGNTRHRWAWKLSSPRAGLIYLLNELMGRTDDASWFVNLSDGGHFENLGLYELVRRRCKYIMVSDAEEDELFSFKGLGNAIRKCRTDFGVDIRINPEELRPLPEPGGNKGKSRIHCAIGEIIYSPQVRGKLLYVKASLTGDEPGDVLEYKLGHSAFPHQSTVDQFFDESQFESYRALGQHIAIVLLMRAVQCLEGDLPATDDAGNGTSRNHNEYMKRLFQYLDAMWYPQTRELIRAGAEHSREYDELLEMFDFGRKDDLMAATRAFFQKDRDWKPKPEFFVHSRMIQLMCRVFHDLDLETMAEHPHNEGWINMFRHWAEDSSFRDTWDVVQDHYDNRFRNFCQRLFLRTCSPKAR